MRRFVPFVLSLALVACGKDAPAPTAAPPSTATPAPAASAAPATSPAAANGDDGIAYPSVAAARSALAERKDVDSREDGGWTIVADQQASAFWSFAPDEHAAHPAVVKRTIHENNGVVSVTMAMLCEGPKTACDELKTKFEDLDERMRVDLQHQADARKQKPAG